MRNVYKGILVGNNAPIGIFDSGIGGISVYRKVRERLPSEDIIYFADQENIPYGSKNLDTVYDYALSITDFLLSKNCKIIVIACNTACAAALHPLRKVYPDVLFVGMEPAVKPAATNTRSGAVGVLATEGTFKGAPYAGVVKRFAQDIKVYEQSCTGLAEAIEQGISGQEIMSILAEWILPLKELNIDQLALACTHYPLVFDEICHVAGKDIEVIDPAAAIARRVDSLLAENNMYTTLQGREVFFTTALKSALVSKIALNDFSEIKYCARNEERCLIEL